MKAFAVIEHAENTGAIIFAKHAIVARRQGAEEYADGELSSVSCHRAPWADAYVGRPVPARVMIAHGWNFECTGCGHTIDDGWLYDNRLPLDGVVGTQHSIVFCGSRCARRYYRLKHRREDQEQRAIETFKAIVRKRFPDADFCGEHPRGHHAYVLPSQSGWQWRQIVVGFRFPGMKYGLAHLRFDISQSPQIGPPKPEYTVPNGDWEAFKAYAQATNAAGM